MAGGDSSVGGDGARYKPSPNAVAKRVGDEVVLVHLQTNRIYTLNRTGARFWELLSEGGDLERAREQMLIEFEIGDDQLRAESEALVNELVTRGMLEPDAGG
jgi:coenzyme PQQ synthesis protein D (PqqD)